MGNVIDISEARQRKKFPPLKLVHSDDRAFIDWLEKNRNTPVSAPCDCGDTEPPEPRPAA